MATNDVSTIYQVDQTTGDLINPNRTVINLNREKVLWTGNLGNITDTITIPAADLDGVIELQFSVTNYGNGAQLQVDNIITLRMDSLQTSTTYVGNATPTADVTADTATFGLYSYSIKIIKATDGALTISNSHKGYFTKNGMAYVDRATAATYCLTKITARMPLLLADTYTKAEVDAKTAMRKYNGNVSSTGGVFYRSGNIVTLRMINNNFSATIPAQQWWQFSSSFCPTGFRPIEETLGAVLVNGNTAVLRVTAAGAGSLWPNVAFAGQFWCYGNMTWCTADPMPAA